MPEKFDFRSLLKSFRVRRGPEWTQAKTAEYLRDKGIKASQRLYTGWENGESLPSSKDLRLIANCFVLNTDEEATFYLAASQSPPRTHNLPFDRNPFFTGRQAYLHELDTLLRETGMIEITQAVSIHGQGGIGKTQLALEYAYANYPKGYLTVLWVNAAEEATLRVSYDDLMDTLELPERSERDPELRVQAVKRWLAQHTGWLLIMDNAENLQLVKAFLPEKPLGSIMVTTRSQIFRDANIAAQLRVDKMKPEEGVLFLLRRSGLIDYTAAIASADAHTQDMARQLVDMLDGHPLALDHAAAYIEAKSASLDEYMQIYQEEHQRLLDTPRPPGDYHPETVTATINLCFRKACEQHPMVASMLRFCSFMQPDAMPEEVLYQDADLALTIRAFHDSMEAVRQYSLVERNRQEKTLSMHRIVQTIVRDGMPRDHTAQWQVRVVRALDATFPEGDFADWKQCGRLLPHALNCATWTDHEILSTTAAANLFHRAGVYADDQARYTEAELLLTRAISIREQCVGPEHLDTAQSLNNLGWLYDHMGKYEQAVLLHQRALAIREKGLGPESPPVAESLNRLAVLYRHQLQYDQAEQLHRRALEIREKQLGPEHSDTAESLNNLGLLYSDMKRYGEAESLLMRSLAVREKRLGMEHPDVAESLNNLAFLYDFQERYAEAEPIHLRALAIREKHLGPEHPNVAQSLTNLAWLYDKLKRYEEAEQLFQRTLAIDMKACGPEHPYVADDLFNLAVLYDNRGKYEQAEPLYRQALTIQERQLGATHQYTKETKGKYSNLLYKLGRTADAEVLGIDS